VWCGGRTGWREFKRVAQVLASMNCRFALAWMTTLACVFSSSASQAAGPQPLQVVASFSILADITREIAGDAAVVTSLVAPNADAHVFEPTPKDAQRLKAADLVVVNGLKFEGWMDRLVKSSGYKGALVVATADIKPRLVRSTADPHAWQSLPHAQRYVKTIADALSRARPDQAAAIAARAASYSQKLKALDDEARQQLAAVPEAQRRVITSHDAFAYLGEAYNITFIAPQGWTTSSDASASTVAAAIRQIKSQQARALFVENMTDRRLIDRIANETGAVVGGTLYSDALSLPGTEADTYLKLYAHNLQQLVTALRSSR
jgi:zinc/manganese transport system substrate-binding protein